VIEGEVLWYCSASIVQCSVGSQALNYRGVTYIVPNPLPSQLVLYLVAVKLSDFHLSPLMWYVRYPPRLSSKRIAAYR
jgi:hypothetical protein